MKELTYEEYIARALRRPCSTCGSKPGDECFEIVPWPGPGTIMGAWCRPLETPHAERLACIVGLGIQ